MPPRPSSIVSSSIGPNRARRLALYGLILVILGILLAWLWRLESVDPLAEWRQFPRTYLPAGTVTTDPTMLVIVPGGPESPPEIRQAEKVLHPAYIHPDLHTSDGRPLIFTVTINADGDRVTPRLPPDNKPLGKPAVFQLKRYQTSEGETLLARFREVQKP
jgi:hypothetical protein